MRFYQQEIQLKPNKRRLHLITDVITKSLIEIKNIQKGILQVFIKHSSASLTINENADYTVRGDFERHFNVMVPEDATYYEHTYEGPDDMPAHIKSSILGSCVQIPITQGRLNLGIWQGIYVCEHRNNATSRSLVITTYGV